MALFPDRHGSTFWLGACGSIVMVWAIKRFSAGVMHAGMAKAKRRRGIHGRRPNRISHWVKAVCVARSDLPAFTEAVASGCGGNRGCRLLKSDQRDHYRVQGCPGLLFKSRANAGRVLSCL